MSHFRGSNSWTQPKPRQPVYINVYDLHSINNFVYYFGIGAFHSGVEVYGTEYSFGGHDSTFSGVFEIEPKSASGVIFRESIMIGETTMTNKQVQNLVDKLSDDYAGCSYHPLQKNCNSFTKELVKKLLDKDIPEYINRLAHIGNMFSCLIPTGLAFMKTPNGGQDVSTEKTSLTYSNISNISGASSSGTPGISSSLNTSSSTYSSFPGTGYSLSNSTTSTSILSSLSPPSSPGTGSPKLESEDKRNKLLIAANKRMFEQQLINEENEPTETLEASNLLTATSNTNDNSSYESSTNEVSLSTFSNDSTEGVPNNEDNSD